MAGQKTVQLHIGSCANGVREFRGQWNSISHHQGSAARQMKSPRCV
jgi:hypothetical protein